MSHEGNKGGNTISFLRVFLFVILALLLIRLVIPMAPHHLWMLLHRKAKARHTHDFAAEKRIAARLPCSSG